ncbi:MAG: 7-carboxy-7-deazaguanine synthase QueE [Planctomycetes bacterium]|nr:7-carboxy-7-deazaguanine synthase QueE [Planctomycetota bacterium]
MSDSGSLLEVFLAVQGEGVRVGELHLFVRLFGCNLACDYCDTAIGDEAPGEFPVTIRDFSCRHKNPVIPAVLASVICGHLPGGVGAVAVTGGEPLVQAGFLALFLEEFRRIGMPTRPDIYLETNGTLPDEITAVEPLVDMVAMDIKLPSVYGGRALWDEHTAFLAKVAHKTFVKVVVGRSVSMTEFQQAVDLIAAIDPSIPLVIQPVWPVEVGAALLLDLQARALARLQHVRIIVQQQEILGMP